MRREPSRAAADEQTGAKGDARRHYRADMPRQRDLDGSSNLSRWALAEFTAWFLNICLDQVTFMTGLFALDTLVDRLHDAARITGLPGTQRLRSPGDARRGRHRSNTPKDPVLLRFPLHAIELLFPSRFLEA
jgi:hypothetical protein